MRTRYQEIEKPILCTLHKNHDIFRVSLSLLQNFCFFFRHATFFIRNVCVRVTFCIWKLLTDLPLKFYTHKFISCQAFALIEIKMQTVRSQKKLKLKVTNLLFRKACKF